MMLARTSRGLKALLVALLFILVHVSPIQGIAGALDPTFGGEGKVTTDFGANELARAVAIQPNGTIVAAGASGGDFALARSNRDGSLDTSFDLDGKVTTDFGFFDDALAVAIQPNGKILAAGTAFTDRG